MPDTLTKLFFDMKLAINAYESSMEVNPTAENIIRNQFRIHFLQAWVDVFSIEDVYNKPLIIPVNDWADTTKNGLPGIHWFVIAFDFSSRTLWHMDSAKGSAKSTFKWCEEFLVLFLELMDIKNDEREKFLVISLPCPS